MAICHDKATLHLGNLGYNLVRNPSARVRPLELIGRQADIAYLGPLNRLMAQVPGPAPDVRADLPDTAINGAVSSKLDFSIGASILVGIIGAMGGGLGVHLDYTDADTLEFGFAGVSLDEVEPAEAARYLRGGSAHPGNPVLQQYVLGSGDLFLVTRAAKSKTFTVKYERRDHRAAKVNVPVLRAALGSNIQVSASGQADTTLSVTGPAPLVFAFQCFHVGVEDGSVSLVSLRAGGAPVGAATPIAESADLLAPSGLVSLRYL
jgi:hypothetical protein